MHDPRIPTASAGPVVVGLERIGRIRLPAPATAAMAVEAGGEVRMRSNRLAIVVRRDGPGAAATVDRRGRLFVPVWLRRRATYPAVVLAGTAIDRPLVVVAPVVVLGGIGGLLAGEVR